MRCIRIDKAFGGMKKKDRRRAAWLPLPSFFCARAGKADGGKCEYWNKTAGGRAAGDKIESGAKGENKKMKFLSKKTCIFVTAGV